MGAPDPEISRIRGIPFFGLGGHYTTGNIFFVDSGHTFAVDDANQGKDPTEPFKTIDYAIGQCTASNGDIVYVMPGHTETVKTAAGIDIDVAGVRVIGLGSLWNRPTITISTATTASIELGAANTHMENFIVVVGVDSLVSVFELTSGKNSLKNIRVEGGSTYQFLGCFNMTTTADNFYFENIEVVQSTDPTGTGAADDTGVFYCEDSENIFISNLYVHGHFETGIFHNKTTKCQNLWMRNIYGNNLGCTGATAVPITLVDTSTGGIVDSLIVSPQATDITVAKIVGVPGSLFYLGRTANFGNDSGGGQLAAFGDAEAS